MLRDGSVDSRSAAAEKLFNKAAEDETARTRTASLGVVQPLVRTLDKCTAQRSLCSTVLVAQSGQQICTKRREGYHWHALRAWRRTVVQLWSFGVG